jgi:putative transposase
MPRSARIVIANQPHHVVHRGNNRCAIFTCDRDRRVYLGALKKHSAIAECAIHAYTLMTTHVHVVLTPKSAKGLARMMHLMGGYAQYFNERHDRTGSLYEGRFWSSVIDSECHFFVCCGYVEHNSQRAGMVEAPGDYRWSSYRHNAHGFMDPLITPHELYASLGAREAERLSAYRAMYNDGRDRAVVDAIRLATRRGGRLSATLARMEADKSR